MKTHLYHTTLTLITLTLLAITASPADAEVRVDLFSSIELPLLNQTLIHPTTAELGPITSSVGSNTGDIHARASLSAPSLLKAQASSTIIGANVRSTAANASWQDVLLAPTTGALASIRFNFTINGQFTVTRALSGSPFSADVSRAITNITTRRGINFSPPNINLDTTTAAVSPEDLMVRIEVIDRGSAGSTFDAQAFAGTSQAWLTESLVETSPGIFDFTGSFAITSPLSTPTEIGFGATRAGYPLSLGLTTLAGSRDAISASDFFNTIQLSSITQPDGSPLPPSLNLIFESGLTIPEPSTLTFLAFAPLLLTNRRVSHHVNDNHPI